ncbi:MAG: hypothetical protein LBU73_00710 [Helicobacteraceae bacterium]|jgi:hypothetical protein|nr:hypothetical protein [Helicobacteraceae bacterium]
MKKFLKIAVIAVKFLSALVFYVCVFVFSLVGLVVCAELFFGDFWRYIEAPPKPIVSGEIFVADERASADGVLRFHREIGADWWTRHDIYRLECFKNFGLCFDFVVHYFNLGGRGSTMLQTYVYEIAAWDQDMVAAFRDDFFCVKSSWFLDLKTKNAYYIRTVDETVQNDGRCIGYHDAEALLMNADEVLSYDEGKECESDNAAIRVCRWEQNYLANKENPLSLINAVKKIRAERQQ